MTPVVVADVTKRYRRRGPTVLNGVRLELPPGSITQLRGSNGSGKSTLLRLLAGVTRPTSGRIDGRPPVVGYVPERFPSDLRFTPRQYLRWLGRIRGLPAARVADRIEGLADGLGLSPSARDQPMRHLSKGTTQKVAVIQALLDWPALLLLDEAWTGLDADARSALSELVVRRRSEGCVIVFADHGQHGLGLRPDATWLVLDGRLTTVGPA
jgi:ABC-2 type transport system ATP-binding protein